MTSALRHRIVQLRSARASREFVQVRIRRDEDTLTARVLRVGPTLVLLAVVAESVASDGYSILRLADVESIERPHPHARFIRRALAVRDDAIRRAPAIDLASVESMLISAARLFPLVAIGRADAGSDASFVGSVVELGDGVVTLRYLNPDAAWETRPERIPLSQVSRVDLGGRYLDALAAVALGGRRSAASTPPLTASSPRTAARARAASRACRS